MTRKQRTEEPDETDGTESLPTEASAAYAHLCLSCRTRLGIDPTPTATPNPCSACGTVGTETTQHALTDDLTAAIAGARLTK